VVREVNRSVSGEKEGWAAQTGFLAITGIKDFREVVAHTSIATAAASIFK